MKTSWRAVCRLNAPPGGRLKQIRFAFIQGVAVIKAQTLPMVLRGTEEVWREVTETVEGEVVPRANSPRHEQEGSRRCGEREGGVGDEDEEQLEPGALSHLNMEMEHDWKRQVEFKSLNGFHPGLEACWKSLFVHISRLGAV